MSGETPGTDTYTHGHHASVLKSHSWRTAANSAAYLVPHLKPGVSVLDVGCGPGTITVDFADLVDPGLVVGVDRAADVLAKAEAYAAANRPAEAANLEFRVGDGYKLDFDDNSFDVAHAHQVLQHVSDPVATLSEMKRVVSPSGVVAVCDADYGGMFWSPHSEGLAEWMRIYQLVARRNDAEPNAGRHLLGWANQVGFSRIEASANTWCFASEAERKWWGGLWADRITESAMARQAVDYGIASEQELARISQAWTAWSADPDGWFAITNSQLLLWPGD